MLPTAHRSKTSASPSGSTTASASIETPKPGANNFWVFAGGLTDVEVTLTVTDTESGEVRTYGNPIGTPFQPIQDTNAFNTCP